MLLAGLRGISEATPYELRWVWQSTERRGDSCSWTFPMSCVSHSATGSQFLQSMNRVGRPSVPCHRFSGFGFHGAASAFRRPVSLVPGRLSGTPAHKVRHTTQDRGLLAEGHDGVTEVWTSWIGFGGWRTLRRGTGVNPCTIETRGGAESFLRFMRKRFGF